MTVTDEPVLDVPAAPGPGLEEFHALVLIEGQPTLDGPPTREYAPGSVTWPDKPVPVMLKLDNSEGHDAGVLAGAITRFERRGAEIHGWGYSDTGSEAGVELARLIAEGAPVGVSIGPDGIADADVELVMPEDVPAQDEPEALLDEAIGEPEHVVFHAGRLREVTVLPVAAQVDTYVEPGQGTAAPADEAVVEAAAIAGPEPGGRPGYTPAPGDRVAWPVGDNPDGSWIGVVESVDEEAGTAQVVPDVGGPAETIPLDELTPLPEDEVTDEGMTAAVGEQTISARFAAFLDRQRASVLAAAEVVDLDQSAAPDVQTSGMIALVPSADDAARLAVDGGEPVDQLHVTLAFLGDDVTGLDPQARERLAAAVAETAAQSTIAGQTWAVAHFNPTGDNPAAVYLVGDDTGALAALRDAVASVQAEAGLDAEEHSPWVPHLTVSYGGDMAALAEVGTPVTFDRLRLALGQDVTDFPLAGEIVVDDEPEEIPVNDSDALIASAALEAPPAAWFGDPGLTRPTPLTVTADGRVFGHLATWGSCHTGYGGACVTPPRERDLGYYTVGEVLCAGGERIPVGQITLGTGHAGQNDSAMAAARHYDDTGAAVADVAAGNDRHGIWLAGSLRAGVTPEQVHVLRASALSGDWRRIGGSLRLVAALAVNVPGFPIPRTRAMVASGVQTALVAAAVVDPDVARHSYLAELVARDVGRDRRSRAEALVASVHPEQD